jgi:hypothetical protein
MDNQTPPRTDVIWIGTLELREDLSILKKETLICQEHIDLNSEVLVTENIGSTRIALGPA